MSIDGVGTPVSRPSSWTAVTSASISSGRPRSRSCSIDVLWAPTAAGARDAAVDVDREADAELLADRLRLDHHRPRHRAGAGIADDLCEGSAGQGGDRVEGQVPPQLHPDVAPDVAADRGPEAGGDQRFGEAGDAIAAFPRRLAERKAVALDMADHAGRFDLGRRIDDAADDAGRIEARPDRAAGVDRLEAGPRERPAVTKEVPPGHAVLRRDHGRLRPEQRRRSDRARPAPNGPSRPGSR